jgi:ATP-dependent DNA helicase PIF1
MTIHKAQGQTFDKVGIFLRQPVFTHGPLYVACPRVWSFDSLRVQAFDGDKQGRVNEIPLTDNFVFNKALQHLNLLVVTIFD